MVNNISEQSVNVFDYSTTKTCTLDPHPPLISGTETDHPQTSCIRKYQSRLSFPETLKVTHERAIRSSKLVQALLLV